MKKLIESFPEQLTEALEIAGKQAFKPLDRPIFNVVICGLGGSGIGAKIVSNWLFDEIKLPIILVNDYTIPNFVNDNSLVIGSSYSGSTEETVMAMKDAKEKGAFIMCITSGGYLASFCDENNFDFVLVPGGNPPRSALAYSLVQLVNYFTKLALIGPQKMLDIVASVELLRTTNHEIHQTAKEMAAHLYGKIGVFYGETKYEGVLVRARQQFNENSKYLGWSHIIPEMNHNELVGWGGGDERFAPVFFLTSDYHPRNLKRYEISKAVIEDKSNAVFVVESKGDTLVSQSLFFIHVVDWASYYLCEMNEADIMDIKIIDYLKSELAKL